MNKTLELLKELDACSEASDWVEDNANMSPTELWNSCKRSDWMTWILTKMNNQPGWPNREKVLELLCNIVELALPVIPKDIRENPEKAIETARLYTKGKASLPDYQFAANAANNTAIDNEDISIKYAASAACNVCDFAAYLTIADNTADLVQVAYNNAAYIASDIITNITISISNSKNIKRGKVLEEISDYIRNNINVNIQL